MEDAPHGWLIKDFADGWAWTGQRIQAVVALTEGHAVWSVSRGCFEDDGTERDSFGWTVSVGPDSITRRSESK